MAQMKKCSKCQSTMSDDKKFCDECGSPIPEETTAPKVNSEKTYNNKQTDSNVLVLRTWKPWRWLFTEKYGEVAIASETFTWDLYPTWRHRAFKIIVQIFSYGFNPLSYLTNNGHSPIKNVNMIALISPQWIKWRYTFFIINSGGFVGVYPIPAEDLDKARAFKELLRSKSNEYK